MVMRRAASNDTESKLHENAGGGQIARNDEREAAAIDDNANAFPAFASIFIIADLGDN